MSKTTLLNLNKPLGSFCYRKSTWKMFLLRSHSISWLSWLTIFRNFQIGLKPFSAANKYILDLQRNWLEKSSARCIFLSTQNATAKNFFRWNSDKVLRLFLGTKLFFLLVVKDIFSRDFHFLWFFIIIHLYPWIHLPSYTLVYVPLVTFEIPTGIVPFLKESSLTVHSLMCMHSCQMQVF